LKPVELGFTVDVLWESPNSAEEIIRMSLLAFGIEMVNKESLIARLNVAQFI